MLKNVFLEFLFIYITYAQLNFPSSSLPLTINSSQLVSISEGISAWTSLSGNGSYLINYRLSNYSSSFAISNQTTKLIVYKNATGSSFCYYEINNISYVIKLSSISTQNNSPIINLSSITYLVFADPNYAYY